MVEARDSFSIHGTNFYKQLLDLSSKAKIAAGLDDFAEDCHQEISNEDWSSCQNSPLIQRFERVDELI